MEYNLTKSTRKFIRSEKALIRRQFLDFKKQEEMISELYKKLLGKNKIQKIKQKSDVKNQSVKVKITAKKSKPKTKIKKVKT